MDCDCGVDAGGTKAAWMLRDLRGSEVARGVAPAIQAAALGVEGTAVRLRALLAELEGAGHRIRALVAGLAGAGRVEVRRGIRAAVGAEIPFAVVGDPEVAAGAALAEGPGVAVWAGTGSFVVARGVDGRLLRIGGRGWLLGDRGGAFAVVRAAAAAAVEAADGLRPESGLGAGLAEAFSASRVVDLGAVMQQLTPGEVAARLPVVAEACAAGDRIACAVVAEEADWLVRACRAAAERAGVALVETGVRFGGGALQHCAPLREALAVGLAERGVEGFAAGGEAVVGAARLAAALRTGEQPMRGWLDDERSA